MINNYNYHSIDMVEFSLIKRFAKSYLCMMAGVLTDFFLVSLSTLAP